MKKRLVLTFILSMSLLFLASCGSTSGNPKIYQYQDLSITLDDSFKEVEAVDANYALISSQSKYSFVLTVVDLSRYQNVERYIDEQLNIVRRYIKYEKIPVKESQSNNNLDFQYIVYTIKGDTYFNAFYESNNNIYSIKLCAVGEKNTEEIESRFLPIIKTAQF